MDPATNSLEFSGPVANSPRSTGSPLRNPRIRKGLGSTQPASVQYNQTRNASNPRIETNNVSPPLAKTQDYGSGSSRQGSEQRQSLSEKAARLRGGKDTSQISNQRPPDVDVTVRGSRFGGAKKQRNSTGESLPSRFSSRQDFVQQPIQINHTGSQGQIVQDLPTSNTGTQQSFAVPHMPNITELVSGVYENGTPVFSHDGKSRMHPQQRQTSRPDPAQVDDISVDDEEQDIYVSLKLLQDRVVDLEYERAETDFFVQELQQKNKSLETEKARSRSWPRSDSAIGMTDGASDGGDEKGANPRKLLIEKNRECRKLNVWPDQPANAVIGLESCVRGLQNEVESSDRKVNVAETALRNVTKERDSAVSQLAIAFFNIEQLKADNASLLDENQAFKTKLAAVQDDKEDRSRQAPQEHVELPQLQGGTDMSPVDPASSVPVEEVGKPTRRRMESGELPSSFDRFQAKLAQRRAEREAQIPSADANGRQSPTQVPTQTKEASRKFSYETQTSFVEPHPTDLFPRGESNQPVDCYEASENGRDLERERRSQVKRASRALPKKRQQSGVDSINEAEATDLDFTYISFIEVSLLSSENKNTSNSAHQSKDVAEIRGNIEKARKGHKSQPSSGDHISQVDNFPLHIKAPETRREESNAVISKKASLQNASRDVTGIDTIEHTGRSFEEADMTQQSKKSNAEHNRRHSEPVVGDNRKLRQSRKAQNMTSAFILPDITIRHPSSGPIRQVSAGAQAVLDDIEYHNGQSCTVCHQLIERGKPHQHQGEIKRTITVPKPIPVSERMPEADEYNEEPTIRPAQPPSLALATVMKGLEDELKHLKIQLSQYQDLYNGHDPALSRRQRKQVSKKIEGLMKDIDVKADQIYNLYDVLEGQKQSGHEMTEQEVEVTLHSIMIEASETDIRDDGEMDDAPQPKPTQRHPWDLESSDEEGLPWEGIESTATGKSA